MLKMTIDNEEVLSNNDISIKEEILSPSSTILNNVYPKSWEQDKDYVSRFYYPKDYSKLNIQNFSVEPEEAGTTIDINGNATLTDVDTTKESRVLRLLGQTSQVQYTGKNLLFYEEFPETVTQNGIIITNNYDGTFKVNGTATADVSSAINLNTFIPMTGTWRMLGCPSGGSSSTYMLSAYVGYWGAGSPNIDTGSGTNITYTGNVKVRFYIKSGTTCNNLIFKPMLTTDTSATINNFEPYVGGTASPNPSYPQNVNVVSGDNEINICGKNLYNKDNAVRVGANNQNIKFTTNLIPNTQYTFNITTNRRYATINLYDSSGTQTRVLGGYSEANKFTFTTNSNEVKGEFVFYAEPNVDISTYDFNGVQIEKGSTATTYEPYIGSSYPLYLGVENLFDKSSTPIYFDSGMQYTETDTGCKLRTSSSGNGFVLVDLGDIKEYENKSLTFSMSNTPNSLYQYIAFIACNNNGSDRLTIGSALGSSSNTLTISVGSNYTQTRLTIRLYINGGTANTDYELNNIMVEKGSKANSYSAYGTTPIELCKIGTYQDYIYKGKGYNLFDKDNVRVGYRFGSDGDYYQNAGYNATEFISVKPNTTYSTSWTMVWDEVVCTYDANQTFIRRIQSGTNFTTSASEYYIRADVSNAHLSNAQLNEGSTALPYEPYNAKDKWLVHKEIGKVVLDGSENWGIRTDVVQAGYTCFMNGSYVVNSRYTDSNITNLYCNYFVILAQYTGQPMIRIINVNGYGETVMFPSSTASTEADFKTWLSNHNTILYYVLPTPTATLITDTTLISQLESLSS